MKGGIRVWWKTTVEREEKKGKVYGTERTRKMGGGGRDDKPDEKKI